MAPDPYDSLTHCLACDADTVHPVSWEEHDATSWAMLLRCGSCGTWREDVVSDEQAAAYDDELDAQQAQIQAAYEELVDERLKLEAQKFMRQLDADRLARESGAEPDFEF